MGGNGKKQQQKPMEEDGNSIEKQQEELLKSIGDFTSKDQWDQFYTNAGSNYSCQLYAEWAQFQSLLTAQLVFPSSPRTEYSGAGPPAMEAADVCILVPGCGNSRLSEHLYDAGFRNITNVDFSKVVISDMLRRNVRERPMMKWRVMDMTSMQVTFASIQSSILESETFDVIVDKGGLDALMEPKLGPSLGDQYLSEVQRLLKDGGRYVCLTLAGSHVLDLLFLKFRFWWKMSLYAIDKEPSSRNLKLQTFMVVVEKDFSTVVSEISSFLPEDSIDSHGDQARELCEAFERERKVRSEYSNGSDILHSLNGLNLGLKGNLTQLEPGRRVKLILGEPGVSRFFYNVVLLDAQQDSGPFDHHCVACLVPKMRARDWLFSSEKGQWLIVDHSNSARVILILLDSSNSNVAVEVIKKDLSCLVKKLAPGNCDDGNLIQFVAASDGVKKCKIVHQVTSALAGPIVVEDVIYAKINDALYHDSPSKDSIFRRLIFQRTESLLQSEVLLSTGPNGISSEAEKNKAHRDSKTRKKEKQKQFDSGTSLSPVNHNYLGSSYHSGLVSGLLLISLLLKGCASAEGMVKTVVIGLRAGVLPMFMRNCLPSLKIEVFELDPVVLNVAKDYFGFREDEYLKVSLGDGIRLVEKKAEDSESEGKDSSKIDILIVDVDSLDPSYALTCPEIDFVEEPFLSSVKNALSECSLFIINLVSRSSAVKIATYSRMKMVFSNLLSLKLEEDVSEVIFAVKSECPIKEDQLHEACKVLARKLEQEKPEWGQRMMDASKMIKPL